MYGLGTRVDSDIRPCPDMIRPSTVNGLFLGIATQLIDYEMAVIVFAMRRDGERKAIRT
jgi:hypothetical protein